jgi:hypothetical protein
MACRSRNAIAAGCGRRLHVGRDIRAGAPALVTEPARPEVAPAAGPAARAGRPGGRGQRGRLERALRRRDHRGILARLVAQRRAPRHLGMVVAGPLDGAEPQDRVPGAGEMAVALHSSGYAKCASVQREAGGCEASTACRSVARAGGVARPAAAAEGRHAGAAGGAAAEPEHARRTQARTAGHVDAGLRGAGAARAIHARERRAPATRLRRARERRAVADG